jgi:hypothetical protein
MPLHPFGLDDNWQTGDDHQVVVVVVSVAFLCIFFHAGVQLHFLVSPSLLHLRFDRPRPFPSFAFPLVTHPTNTRLAGRTHIVVLLSFVVPIGL